MIFRKDLFLQKLPSTCIFFFFYILCVSQQSYQDGHISAVHMWLFINRQKSLALTRLMGSLALSNLMF